MIPRRSSSWEPAVVDPLIVGWYECRWFDGDIPSTLWFDGSLWLHEPGGEPAFFGNGIDDDDNESWRGPVKAPSFDQETVK